MDRSGLQRVIPIILIVIVIGLAGWALFSLGKSIFFGGGSKSSTVTTTVNKGKEALTQTTSDRSVVMNVRGPIVADENYHTYSITISTSGRNMTTFQGYSSKQVDTEQLSNTTAGYEQFVYALDRAKLMDGTPLTGDANDTRGICATGILYEFQVLQDTTIVQSLWTSTCQGSKGSLKANIGQITDLFSAQIPDFLTRLKTVSFNQYAS